MPAFHLSSFVIPPQVLTYYVVLSQRLRKALQDDEVFYGLAVSPKLVDTLTVSTLALQDVLPRAQWISMSMDESSMYVPKLTTETIAHEISHFVGQENRSRQKRKECMMRCAFHEIIAGLLVRVEDRINRQCSYSNRGNNSINGTFMFRWEELADISKALWEQAIKVCGSKYSTAEDVYMGEVENLIWEIPVDLDDYPVLGNELFNLVWNKIKNDEERYELFFSYLRDHFFWKSGVSLESAPMSKEENNLSQIVKGEVREIFFSIIEEYSRLFKNYSQKFMDSSEVCTEIDEEGENKEDVRECVILDRLQYMFRETFADLQAIFLLNMQWKDYCDLLQRQEGSKLTADTPLRMLVVTKVLLNEGIWKEPLDYGGEEFDTVKKAAQLDVHKKMGTLAELNFNVSFVLYLIEYLEVCAKRINEDFSNFERKNMVDELRALHGRLADDASIIDFQKTLLSFIEAYQEELLRGEVN